jgi:chromodomain-helicase-DNA-binding protein 7
MREGDTPTYYEKEKEKEPRDKEARDKEPKAAGEMGWSKAKIVTLQSNLLKFGWGRWRVIADNCKFNCPVSDIKMACHAMLGWMLATVPDKYPVVEAIHRQSIGGDNAKLESKFQKRYKLGLSPSVVSGAVGRLGRLDALYFLNGLIKSCKNLPDDIPVTELAAGKPNEWWTPQDDKVLLHHIWVNGYGQYADLKLSSEEEVPVAKLTTRVKALINWLKTVYIRYKDIMGEELAFNCETLEKAINSWTRKEHRQILHILLNFGFPSGADICRVSGIAKKPAEVERYVQDVINYCTEIISSDDQNPQPKGLVEKIQPGPCARILQRIEFFKTIRKSLVNPRFRDEDLDLVHYVATNGFMSLTESRMITERFGTEQTEGQVIRALKTLLKDGQKRITQAFSNKYEIPLYPQNEDGSPRFPLRIGQTLVVLAMGNVVYDREGFHCPRYVYPDGYLAERMYASVSNPDERVWYTCKIMDRGGDQPIFRVELRDDPDVGFEGTSPSNPWLTIVRKVEEAKRLAGMGGGRSQTVSGPEFFGLASSIVGHLMQVMPNVDKLTRFMKKTGVQGRYEDEMEPIDDDLRPSPPRAVIPARRSQRIKQRMEIVIKLDRISEAARKSDNWDLILSNRQLRPPSWDVFQSPFDLEEALDRLNRSARPQ